MDTNESIGEDYRWLFSEQAAPILDECKQMVLDRVNAVKIAKRLRKKTTAARSAIVMELTRLRLRARAKFSRSDQMLLTRKGYEQATDERIAWLKAHRFQNLKNVADVCCGIGGDLIALAERQNGQQTVGVDRDPLCCFMAEANCEVYGRGGVSVVQSDFDDFDGSPFDAIHIDPDRREKTRVVKPDLIQPPLTAILQRYQSQSLGIKLAPATGFDEQVARNQIDSPMERHWIGSKRECKQQMLWTGSLVRFRNGRTASSVHDDGYVEQFSAKDEELNIPAQVAANIGRYVFEPHPAVRAAQLIDALANQRGLFRLSRRIHFLTGTRPEDLALLSVFRVLDLFPTSVRKIGKRLMELDCGEVEVKHRGVDQVSADQIKRLKLTGDRKLTVILSRMNQRRIAIICLRRKIRHVKSD